MITRKEQYLYGSKRLGLRKPNVQLAAAPHTAGGYQTPNEPQAPGGWFNNDCMCYTYEEPVAVGSTPPPPANTTFTARFYTHTLGKKEYELTNHASTPLSASLGNVLATVLDRKTGVKASSTATTYAYFKADVTTAQDYYPFGSLMPGRTYVAPANAAYRFGFNGMQRDDELKGPGNALDFGARMYDSRLGRWWSVDPLAAKYPNISSYVFVGNNPLLFVDPDGKEIIIHYGDRQKFSYKPGIKPPDDAFVADVVKALDYLYGNSKNASKLIEWAVHSPDLVNVVKGEATEYFAQENGIDGSPLVNEQGGPANPDLNTITFNENLGIELVNNTEAQKKLEVERTGTGEIQSPALGLIHELKHFQHDVKNNAAMGRRYDSKIKNYRNKEERKAIRFENKVARELGEPTRTNHSGISRVVKGVLSREVDVNRDISHQEDKPKSNSRGGF